jgi:hypothetical protein
MAYSGMGMNRKFTYGTLVIRIAFVHTSCLLPLRSLLYPLVKNGSAKRPTVEPLYKHPVDKHT